MEKEFVSYEQAVALKELGFKEDCLASYYYAGKRLGIGEYINHGNYTILSPLKQQAFRWFRGKYEFNYYVGKHVCCDIGCYYDYVINDYECDEIYKTYEEAENELINELILIAKRKI